VDRLEQTDLHVMLRALADAPRLCIVAQLARQGEVSVTHLSQVCLISQPLVSWHLRMLRRAGMVRTRRLGRQVYCSLDLERFRACLHALVQLVAPGEAAPEAWSDQMGVQGAAPPAGGTGGCPPMPLPPLHGSGEGARG
jgi:ArsR family transcriptional regulator